MTRVLIYDRLLSQTEPTRQFAEAVREIRAIRRMSAREVAEATNGAVSRSTLAKIESGSRSSKGVTLNEMFVLAEACGFELHVSVHYAAQDLRGAP